MEYCYLGRWVPVFRVPHVMTPSGASSKNSLRVGDEVLTPKGITTKVTSVLPVGRKNVWELELEDNRVAFTYDSQVWKILISDLDDLPTEYYPEGEEWVTVDEASYGALEAHHGLTPRVVTSKELKALLEHGYPVYLDLGVHDPDKVGINTSKAHFYYCTRGLARRKQLEIWSNGGICKVSRSLETKVQRKYVTLTSYPEDRLVEVIKVSETRKQLAMVDITVEDEDCLYLADNFITSYCNHKVRKQ